MFESLQSSGLKEFLNITEPQALEMSIQRGVTSGKGLGFGYCFIQAIMFRSIYNMYIVFSNIGKQLSTRMDGAVVREQIVRGLEENQWIVLDLG